MRIPGSKMQQSSSHTGISDVGRSHTEVKPAIQAVHPGTGILQGSTFGSQSLESQ